MIFAISLAYGKKNRRIPGNRQLKGGGGGGGGSSSTVVDPNNFVVPEGFEFHEDPPWPPQSTWEEIVSFIVEVILYILFMMLITHLYG